MPEHIDDFSVLIAIPFNISYIYKIYFCIFLNHKLNVCCNVNVACQKTTLIPIIVVITYKTKQHFIYNFLMNSSPFSVPQWMLKCLIHCLQVELLRNIIE